MKNVRKIIKEKLLNATPMAAPLVRAITALRYRRLVAKAQAALAKPVVDAPLHGLPNRLIVSFTSFPPRYATLPLTVEALLRQTCKPDEIVLWLAEADMAAVTNEMRALCRRGLTIRQCPQDLKSGNKLIHALSAYEDSFIVTCDDDIYYPPDWLNTLVQAHDPHVTQIIGTRAHLAKFTPDGRATSYNSWVGETPLMTRPSADTDIFLTGIGGVLYPPHSMDPRVKDMGAYLTLCSRADDVWFFVMQELAGTPRQRTRKSFEFMCWPSSQLVTLMSVNVDHLANDSQMIAMENAYPEVLALRRTGLG